MHTPNVGIDDLAIYIPQLYLPIEALAEARGLNYAKLSKGLGLLDMSVPDAKEDTATMAANAVLDLIYKNDLDPQQIGRIYLGTESALDGAKPTATYVLDMLQDHFGEQYGPNCFLNCDVIDMTFACIGAVDALQNTLDWASGHAQRIGIVVASDLAKYEMGSGGEYTQGAGAVAMLVKQQPRLLTMSSDFGVATRPVHDFYKPTRKVSKQEIIEEVLDLLPNEVAKSVNVEDLLDKLRNGIAVKGTLDCNEECLELHKVTPIFDGPYSNDCYQARIYEALLDFRRRHGISWGNLLNEESRLVFHLPYAFQARRMFSEIFMHELKARDSWNAFIMENSLEVPCADDYEDREAYITKCGEFLRMVTKTDTYRAFVKRAIAPGEWASSHVGNLYAGSIFLSLMSSLEAALGEDEDIGGKDITFFAYGSGSKSKVFTAKVQPEWRSLVSRFYLRAKLDQRQAIDYPTYEKLHRGQLSHNISYTEAGTFFLADIHEAKGESEGARHYGYRAVVV